MKAAHRLDVPVVFIPFSWDNLTNKGLMRVQPDRVIVWNDIQRREAIELHACVPDSVVIAGAARFDDFFARQPSTSRAEFCPYGLDAASRWCCISARRNGRAERNGADWRWAESFRSSDDPTIRECSLLVRPHPASRMSWHPWICLTLAM